MPAEDSFRRLVEIMSRLRSEDGCPWDRAQTHQSIAHNLIEEAYELYDAIMKADDDAMKEELGDLLLQVVFHSQMASERNAFDIDQVCSAIVEKLIRRHPHVFGSARADTPQEVLSQWEELKKWEYKGGHPLDRIPAAMPALLYALNLQKKAARLGFDWEDEQGVLEKLEEELGELRESIDAGDRQKIEEELGDMLFSLVNLARHLNVDPEAALKKMSYKFRDRVKYVEKLAERQGQKLADMTIDEIDELWEKAKGKGR